MNGPARRWASRPRDATRLVLAAISVCLAGGYFAAASNLRVPLIGDPVGPRTFPFLIAGGFVLCALALAVEGLRAPAGADASAAGERMSAYRDLPLVLGAAAWTGLYFLALEQAGYVLATFVFLAGGIAAFRRCRWTVCLLVAAGCSVGFDLLFVELLGAQLPPGALFG